MSSIFLRILKVVQKESHCEVKVLLNTKDDDDNLLDVNKLFVTRTPKIDLSRI